MTQVLKFCDNVDSNMWFQMFSTGLIGHAYKLYRLPCCQNIRKSCTYLEQIIKEKCPAVLSIFSKIG